MKIVGIIPVRLESARLPNKALKEILGIPMVMHVMERCLLSEKLDDVYVATDSEQVKEIVESYGGKVLMTSTEHQTGTDRIAEAASNIECDIVVNIQGDEALVDPDHINLICDFFRGDMNYDVGILVTPFKKYNSPSDIKTVLNLKDEVMYFSRNDLPSDARTPEPDMLKAYHVVPFKKDFLMKYSQLEKSPLEKIEFNEYLRILENGYKIKALRVDKAFVSVDTEEDLNFVRDQMEKDQYVAKYRAKYQK